MVMLFDKEILPESGKDWLRNTNPYSTNGVYIHFISIVICGKARQHVLLVNYVGPRILLLELES